jgi:hypothetical protein
MFDVLENGPAISDSAMQDDPAARLRAKLSDELDAIVSVSGKSDIFEASRAMDEFVGDETGDRALFELIQNAHDAHVGDGAGAIHVRLDITDSNNGTLYVANRGSGFSWPNVLAIRAIANSTKNVGEGIGNKGLGFRSIETLASDARIFSQERAVAKERFDGYCFRFLLPAEISTELQDRGLDVETCDIRSREVSKYRMATPIVDQPPEVLAFAQAGFATVVVLQLNSASTVSRAHAQVRALLDSDVPLLLFLDRLESVTIAVTDGDNTTRQELRRSASRAEAVPGCDGVSLRRVDLGEQGMFLVARSEILHELLMQAINASIERVRAMRKWKAWSGSASVAIGLPLAGATAPGRLYAFLPMGPNAPSPTTSHVDAPFFTHIDRQFADLGIPLNQFLLKSVADLSARLALASASATPPSILPRAAGVDLVMWEAPHLSVLKEAFERLGTRLGDAPIVPVLAPRAERRWATLRSVVSWPNHGTSVLSAPRVAALCGAPILSGEISLKRAETIERFVRVFGRRSLDPDDDELGAWIESIAAHLLNEGGKTTRARWRSFYEDIVKVYAPRGRRLATLVGRRIFLQRKRRLGRAGPSKTGPLFVRAVPEKKQRRAPLPPAKIDRRIRLLDESIDFDKATCDAFVSAGLLHTYDAVAALKEIGPALTGSTDTALLQAALAWAFEVWTFNRDAAREALATSGVRVPTVSGWVYGAEATFSASWTAQGALLESFLDEATGMSEDCRRFRGRLLVVYDSWPCRTGTQTDWLDFLRTLGVKDGLRAIDSDFLREEPAAVWSTVLRRGDPSLGMDEMWLAEVEARRPALRHPSSVYGRKGRIARLPGQIEFNVLSEAAREQFFRLLMFYLRHNGISDFTFRIGRYERKSGLEDEHADLPTPLGSFLRNASWMRFEVSGVAWLLSPHSGWGSAARSKGPPRFVPHLESAVAEDVAHDREFAKLLFSSTLGLRDWSSPLLAAERLRDLARSADELPTHDQPTFRKEYARAWSEAAAAQSRLPADLSIVVQRGGAEVVVRSEAERARILVASDEDESQNRVFTDAGLSVLAIDRDAVIWVVEALRSIGRDVDLAEGVTVELMVDGEPFLPKPADPLLVDHGLSWIIGVLRVAHETMADGFERRNVAIERVEARVRRLRVRFCSGWEIVIQGRHVQPSGRHLVYAFDHPEYPTLIVPRSRFDWDILLAAVSEVHNLLSARVPSLEKCMLYISRQYTLLRSPTDHELAFAANTDIQTVRKYLAESGDAFTAIRHAVAGLITYAHGRELGLQLRDAEHVRDPGQLRAWLEASGIWNEMTAIFVRLAQEQHDSLSLFETLGLDFARYNAALKDLELGALNNEESLRTQFAAFRAAMLPEILAALRAAHFEDYFLGRSLDAYLERKELAFITFDQEWLSSKFVLDREMVAARVRIELAREVGSSALSAVFLAAESPVEANRRVLRSAQGRLATLVGAWADAHAESPPAWSLTMPHNIVPLLENEGLIDFELISAADVPALLLRIHAWPRGMPPTVDLVALGLTPADIEHLNVEREREREERRRTERSITFAGELLDTDTAEFYARLSSLVDAAYDPACFSTTKTQKLVPPGSAPLRRRGGARREVRGGRRVSDREKEAMGFAGEYLARRYLEFKHKGLMNDACWVSSNAGKLMGGTPNHDAEGFDFRILDTSGIVWMYEVKSSLEDSREFEFTRNEMAVATEASIARRREYRILYVPHVFTPERWSVLELPNPMSEEFRDSYLDVGRTLRMRFELAE